MQLQTFPSTISHDLIPLLQASATLEASSCCCASICCCCRVAISCSSARVMSMRGAATCKTHEGAHHMKLRFHERNSQKQLHSFPFFNTPHTHQQILAFLQKGILLIILLEEKTVSDSPHSPSFYLGVLSHRSSSVPCSWHFLENVHVIH